MAMSASSACWLITLAIRHPSANSTSNSALNSLIVASSRHISTNVPITTPPLRQRGSVCVNLRATPRFNDRVNRVLMATRKDHAGDPVAQPDGLIVQALTRLREWRERRALSQEELARKVGITYAALTRLENLRAAPRPSTCAKLAQVLRCEPEQLWRASTDDD